MPTVHKQLVVFFAYEISIFNSSIHLPTIGSPALTDSSSSKVNISFDVIDKEGDDQTSNWR